MAFASHLHLLQVSCTDLFGKLNRNTCIFEAYICENYESSDLFAPRPIYSPSIKPAVDYTGLADIVWRVNRNEAQMEEITDKSQNLPGFSCIKPGRKISRRTPLDKAQVTGILALLPERMDYLIHSAIRVSSLSIESAGLLNWPGGLST